MTRFDSKRKIAQDRLDDDDIQFYAQPMQEPESVDNDFFKSLAKKNQSPDQRPWVGLTNDQFLEAARLAEDGNYLVAFQRIQQWLKEKNT